MGSILLRMSVKENNKKMKIIQAGFRVMDKRGYNGTGISDIISEAGIPKGSFYHYFKNKVAFTVEVIDFYSQQVVMALKEKLEDQSTTPIKRIHNLYQGYAKSLIDTNIFPYGGFASKLSQEVGEQNPEIQNAASQVFVTIKNLHQNCLKQAVVANELPLSTNVELLAELIIYAWEGAIIRMKGSYKSTPLVTFNRMLEELILVNRTK